MSLAELPQDGALLLGSALTVQTSVLFEMYLVTLTLDFPLGGMVQDSFIQHFWGLQNTATENNMNHMCFPG